MDDPAQKPVTPPVSDPNVIPPVSAAPVSGGTKEAPIPQFTDKAIGMTHEQIEEADKVAEEQKDTYWEANSRELELEKEVEDLGGVEKIDRGEVKLPEDVAREMGIKPTVTVDTPIAQATGFSVSGVSLTDDQLTVGQKKPISTGFRWLSEWFIFNLLKAHYHLKRIKGKIVRQKDA